jgi:Mlc titration factor MtfA (ptsG expression regulator)
MKWIFDLITHLFSKKFPEKAIQWQPSWGQFLIDTVDFYRSLNRDDQHLFNQRIVLFLGTTTIDASQGEVTDFDRLLVASSAIIPVWSFPEWHYFNLKAVHLLPASFNEKFQCGQSDSQITGMVGTGPMAGKMALSKPALYQGFTNSRDKQNVGIHEFVHLIDMSDGECDGYPERLKACSFSIPWFELVGRKINDIENKKSNIRQYGSTNRSEFFAVASEYFFERPRMLEKKHPKLYSSLSKFYRQDVKSIAKDIKPRKKSLCPCGSKKRYKHCCLPTD